MHPKMMTALLLYSYCQGIYSSRRMARACRQRVDYMALTGMQKPDFRTINLFRQRHLKSLGGLFRQVLRPMKSSQELSADRMAQSVTHMMRSSP